MFQRDPSQPALRFSPGVWMVLSILGLSAMGAVAMGLSMAEPWANGDAHRDLGSDGRLGLWTLLIISPYAALLVLSWRFTRTTSPWGAFFAVGALLIGAVGLAAYVNTAFSPLDAQGALVFVFVPLLQLMAGVVLVVACVLGGWWTRSRESSP